MIPEHHKGSAVYGEHIVRYSGSKLLVKDKVVLDIACGSGYGSALLSDTAKKVFGVDIDIDSVEYAKTHFHKSNVEFIEGSGTNIPLPNNSVDVVISYETIEHIKDYKKFLKEIKRVLKSDGLAVISTPNDTEFIEGNHFHIHEFEHEELIKLLHDNFKHTKEWFQATWVSNGLLSKEQITSEWIAKLPVANIAPKKMKEVLYFFVLCSDRQINETIDPTIALSEHWSARTQEQQSNKISNLNAQIVKLQTQFDEQKIHSAKLQKSLEENIEIIKQIHSSNSWKLASKISKTANLTSKIIPKGKKSKK